ncbi:ACP S-malonyltransferase [Nitrosophilus labii]|uniref:ACP S-malonyltransferase n=1 Tax=Nitrosophilus labii TaxID=2706014 RepID=UPI001656BD7E|nr:ACP S-malonyltransferase [Nitrosophilus labii]
MKNVIFLFPGQGSQSFGMGKDFYENSKLAKDLIEESSDRLKIDFKKLMFEENDKLSQTDFTQPAILLVSLIAQKIFSSSVEIKPKYSLGHSLGEFSALASVDALDVLDAVELVHNRGKFMQQASKGVEAAMLAVLGLDDEKVEEICKEAREEGKKVWPANYNSEGQIVLAGIKEDIVSIEPKLKEAGSRKTVLLNMSVASHCPLLDSARAPLKEYLDRFLKDNFISPVVSNVTAKPYSSKDEALSLLDRQLVEPVLYKQSIKNVESEADTFLEFGGTVLKGLNRRLTKVPTLSVTDMKSMEKAIKELEG